MAEAGRFSLSSFIILGLMAVFALFVALVVTPMISQASGIADPNLSFILGGIFAVVAIGCLTGAKITNRKKHPEDNKNV